MNTWKTLLLFISLFSLSAHLLADEITDPSLTDDHGYLVMEGRLGENDPSKAYVWFEHPGDDQIKLLGTIQDNSPKR